MRIAAALILCLMSAMPVCGQVTTTFVPLRSVWKYLDNGTDQGTAWRSPAFNDSAWAQGPAELGYGDNDEATVVGFGPNSAAKYITTYFRRSFTVTGAAGYTTATLRVRRDDGVVIYLNGTEVYRNTMPAGTITYTTLASAAVADEVSLFSGSVSPSLLVEGTNVLAVEIHQNAGSSSDISFDMDFSGVIPGVIPTATAQSAAAVEDTPKAITLAGTDPNGDPLTYSIATQPVSGVLSGSPPAVTYTPAANFSGTDTFTFTVSDGTNISPPAAVTITVAAVNDVPVASPQSVSVSEDGVTSITVAGSDVESHYGLLADYTQQIYNAGLTGITDGLSGATFNESTGTLFLIRNDSAGAGHSYEYNADGTLIRTITQTGFLDTEAIAWMSGTTFAIAEENNNQRITICTIAPGATTLDRTAPGNITWNTPIGSLLNLGIESLCYDPRRNLLYYTAEKPSAGTWHLWQMNPQTGVSTVLCDLNASIATAAVATDLSDMAYDQGTDTLLLLSHESSKIIRIDRSGTVLEQRGFTTAFTQAEALTLTADRLRLFVGGEPKQFARYALPADTLTYSLVTPPAHGTLTGLPPALTYQPQADYNGPDSFSFRVSDGAQNSAPAVVSLTVTAVNDAPAGSPISATVEATEATVINLPVSDADGDVLSVQATGPSHGTLTVSGTAVTYTGEAGYSGPDGFLYTVSDGVETAGPFAVSLTVLPFNLPPVAEPGSATLDEDSSATVNLTATDPENSAITFSIVSPPAHGTLTGTAPTLVYTPAANYHGSDSFTFRAGDGQEFSNTATFSLTVASVNDTPAASGSSAAIEAGYPLNLNLTASDPDGDSLTWQIISMPAHGTLTGSGPSVVYTADIAFAGTDSLTFTVSDGQETSLPAVISITVAAYNLPPAALSGSVTTDEDTPVPATLSASDPELAPLTYAVTVPPQHGTLTGTAPNYVFVPATNYGGADSFTWTASDGVKTSSPAVMSISITPVNDAPTAANVSVPTETSTPAPVTLSGSDTEGSPLTFTILTPPAHGSLSGTAPALIYTPVAGYTGTDSFSYDANDGSLSSAAATVSITITAPALDNLISAGAVWKYLADGSNQGTAWRAPSFADSSWPQGPAQLGYGENDEATVIPYGPDPNNRYINTYFRREFQVPNPNILTGPLKLELVRDDGAVVYVNGTEVFRSNMPAGTIAYNTLASTSVSAADESAWFSTTVSASLLVPGRNVIAVEVHQNVATSTDVSFDLKLNETVPAITRGPYVQMTGPDRATLRWRTSVPTLSVLKYGTAENALTQTLEGTVAKTEHEIHVTGLTPDTRYYYSAGYPLATFVSGPTHYFTTHPPAGTARPYRFWVLGDAGSGTASQTQVRDAFTHGTAPGLSTASCCSATMFTKPERTPNTKRGSSTSTRPC